MHNWVDYCLFHARASSAQSGSGARRVSRWEKKEFGRNSMRFDSARLELIVNTGSACTELPCENTVARGWIRRYL